MALTRVDTGLQSFPDFTRNQQLANAQIYIGVADLDPQPIGNQIQAYIVQENGTQVAVPQPIRTSAGGIPTFNGSPVQIAVAETAYSIKVLNSIGSQIYYQPNNTDLALIDAAQVSYTPAGTGAVATTVEDVLDAQLMVDYVALRAYTGLAKTVRITGLLTTAQPQGIAGFFQYDQTDTTSADNGGTIIVDVIGRRWKRLFNNNIELAWFDVTTDGTGDNSTKIRSAVAAVAALSRGTSSGRRAFHPAIILPFGTIRFTEAGTLTDQFGAGVGLRYVGQGMENTRLLYENSVDPAASSFAAKTTSIFNFELQDMTISVSNFKRFLLHENGGQGGSALFHDRVKMIGNFDRYCEVRGTTLGSETVWNTIFAVLPSAGTFLYVNDTNPQSLNHTFSGCTIGAFAGGGATVLKFLAGGNLRWFGGYSSMSDNTTFLSIEPPTNGLIGNINQDFTFYGWHPEFISGSLGTGVMVNAIRGAFVTFNECNFSQLATNGGTSAAFTFNQVQQSSSKLHLKSCVLTSQLISCTGAVHVLLDGCQSGNLSSHILQAARFNGSNFQRPYIQLRNSASGVPDQDWYALQTSEGEAYNIPPTPGLSVAPKGMIGRANTIGNQNGLNTGLGSTYQSVNILVPIGSTIKSVTLHYLGPNGNVPNAQRKFKIENFDGTKTFLAEQTIPALTTNFVASSGATPLMHLCDSANNQIVKVFGQMAAGAPGGALDDYGYIIVEYY